MAAYRLYFLDGVNRFSRAEWIEAENDGDAIRRAKHYMQDSGKCEIWDRQRLVARLSADDWPD